MMQPTVRIVIVDDHVILLQGIRKLLEAEPGYQVVGEASDGVDGVELIKRLKPDIAIMDITLPRLNGLDAARSIVAGLPRTRVILLTMHKESPYVIEALNTGVHGYVIKTEASADLLRAIREAGRDRMYFSPAISQIVVGAYRGKDNIESDPLTAREREVLQLIAEGNKTKQVAASLGISLKTAESHRTHLMKKLDIHDTAGLVRYAVRRGLIHP
jgi:two-component system response regulator NreC